MRDCPLPVWVYPLPPTNKDDQSWNYRGRMSGEAQELSAVEVRRIDERLQLLHEDVLEIKKGLESRPTHSDLGSFKLLVDKTFDMVEQRMQQDKEIHRQQVEALKSEHARVEKAFAVRLAKVEGEVKLTRDEKDRLYKQFITSVILGVGGLAGTNVFQGFIG